MNVKANSYDPQSGGFVHYPLDPETRRGPNSPRIFDIYEDSRGTLWLGTIGGGLNAFDRKSGLFKYYTYREKEARFKKPSSTGEP